MPLNRSQAGTRVARPDDQLSIGAVNSNSHPTRQMARCLRRMGYAVGRKRVWRLMRMMGLRSLAPGPATSRRNRAHKVYPICCGIA